MYGKEGELTVGHLEAEQTDEEKRGNVGEFIALELQVLVKAHDGRVLEKSHVRNSAGSAAGALTLRMTLSRNCIV